MIGVLLSCRFSLCVSIATTLAVAALTTAITQADAQVLPPQASASDKRDPNNPDPNNPWRVTISTPPTRTTWVGAHTSGADWAAHTGTTYALTGDILSDGWRLRVTGGYGQYRYRSAGREFVGRHGFSKTLLGYRAKLGRLTLNGFAGMANAGHIVVPIDPDNRATGHRYGAAAALEAWYDHDDSIWVSANGSYATVFDGYNVTLRFGHRILSKTSLGLEFATTVTADYAAAQAAALLRQTWSYGEIRASIGALGKRGDTTKPYATISVSLTY